MTFELQLPIVSVNFIIPKNSKMKTGMVETVSFSVLCLFSPRLPKLISFVAKVQRILRKNTFTVYTEKSKITICMWA